MRTPIEQRTFWAKKKVLRDFFPLGVARTGHIMGMSCPCEPYEAYVHSEWTKAENGDRIGVVLSVTINHKQIIPVAQYVENIQDYDGSDKLPVGIRDAVGQMANAGYNALKERQT